MEMLQITFNYSKAGRANQTTLRSQSLSPLKCQVSTIFIVLYIMAAIVTLIVILGNGFILWTLKRQKKSTYDILLCYLSTFDLLAAVTMMARIYTEITKCTSRWLFGRFGCKILLPFYDVSINVSVCILIIISIDRCRTLIQPFGVHKSRTSIHVVAGFSIVLSSVVYFERFMTAQVRGGVCAYFLDSSLLNLSPFLVWSIRDTTFLLIFTSTSFIIKRSLKEVPHLSKEIVRRKKAQSKKVYNNLLMMQIMFTFLVLPFDILSCISLGFVMISKRSITWEPFRAMSGYLFLLQMSNSLANCFIYSRIHRHFPGSSSSSSSSAATLSSRSKSLITLKHNSPGSLLKNSLRMTHDMIAHL